MSAPGLSCTTPEGERALRHAVANVKHGTEALRRTGELRTARPHFEQAGRDFVAFAEAEATAALERDRKRGAPC